MNKSETKSPAADWEPLGNMSFLEGECKEVSTRMQADLSFAAEISERREGKQSEKKSALYEKIMRDHNLLKAKTPTKLNYDIPSLL